MDNKHIRNWYYILPDGSKADNMKEACEMMHIYTGLFKRLIKSGDIKKITGTNQHGSLNTNNTQNGVNYGNTTK